MTRITMYFGIILGGIVFQAWAGNQTVRSGPYPVASGSPSPRPSHTPVASVPAHIPGQAPKATPNAARPAASASATRSLASTNVISVSKKINCVLKPPEALLIDKDPEALNYYKILRKPSSTVEIGRSYDGVTFWITRGGCLEFGETFLFETALGDHSVMDVPYWMHRAARIMRILGSDPSISVLRDRSDEVEDLIEQYPQYEFGLPVKVGKDVFVVDIQQDAKDNVKLQVTVNYGL